MWAGELSADEKRTLKLLRKKPLKIPEIAAELNRDQSVVYNKIIKVLEKKQLIKVGYVRTSKKKGIKVEALCYLPEQEEALKVGRFGMVWLPIEKVVEAKPQADKDTVRGYIVKIDSVISSKKWEECRSRIIELRQFCHRNRTGHITELLDAIRRYVDTEELFENEKTREELAMTMTYILENEKEMGSIETANKVTKQLLGPIRNVALNDRKNGLVYSLRFLGKTEVREAVNIVADLISQRPSEITGNLESEIHYVLFGSELAKAQKEYIQEKLIKLSSFEDEPVRLVAMRLQEKPRLY